MESIQQTSPPVQPDVEERLTFDQYVEQLPTSKQTFHRVIVWLIGAAFLLTFVFIGVILLPAVLIFDLIMVIMASIKANEGQSYRYPLAIQFIK